MDAIVVNMSLEIIETVIPLPQDVLVKKFTTPDIRFIVDYAASSIKDNGFLAYIDNVELHCFVQNPSVTLIEQYIRSTHIIPVNNLVFIHANLLVGVHTNFQCVYDAHMLDYVSIEQLKQIYENNKDVVDSQISIFKSMPLYMVLNSDVMFDQRADLLESDRFKVDKDFKFTQIGKSFVNLLRLSNFSSLFIDPNLSEQSFKEMTYFTFLDDYLFNRHNVSLLLDADHDTCAFICSEISKELK